MKKHIHKTDGIFYCRDSAEINGCGPFCIGLTVTYSEIGNINIPPNRCAACKETDV